ncbi:MAG: class I SAM-dependent methyltransferase [Methanothrix sp.]|nr:class I SAM-dependent methyltransferase [Methanothrix sp.]
MEPTKALALSDAFGMLHREEVLALADLVQKLEPGAKVANVGAGFGTSALTIAEVRPDIELVSVDIRDDDNPFGGFMNERNAFINAGIELKHQQIKGDSPVVAEQFPTETFDLVIIDDDHTYEAAGNSITKWLSRVKPGGYILMHDYDSVMWPDVKTVVDEVAEMFFLKFEWQEDTYICFSRPTVAQMKKKGKTP